MPTVDENMDAPQVVDFQRRLMELRTSTDEANNTTMVDTDTQRDATGHVPLSRQRRLGTENVNVVFL